MASIIAQYNNKRVKIEKKTIRIEDREWFIREYKRSFKFIYNDEEINMKINGKRLIISLENDEKKDAYLLEAAKIKFDDYIGRPKQGYKAISAWFDDTPVGVLLYREMNSDGSLSLSLRD